MASRMLCPAAWPLKHITAVSATHPDPSHSLKPTTTLELASIRPILIPYTLKLTDPVAAPLDLRKLLGPGAAPDSAAV